eukprot:m.90873 g.90873  ORF g.90873 m.90873 type:complete len:359 (-) comp9881_c0_seq1:82-1158(-)
MDGDDTVSERSPDPPRRKWTAEWSIGLFPAVVVHLLLAWAVRVFDMLVLPRLTGDLARLAAYAVVFHVLLVMMVWSYWKTTLTEPMDVPSRFALTNTEFIQMVEGTIPPTVAKRELPVITRNRGSKVAVCATCKVIKPDRCHHCSVCRRCVLKMDHHCPWVNNCVGFHNYKFFVLFIVYTSLFLASMLGMMAPMIIAWLEEKDRTIDSEIPLCGFVGGVMLFLVLPLKCMHCSLVLDNATTLEHMRTVRYSVNVLQGWRLPTWFDNVAVACGPRVALWPFPVQSAHCDGVHWDVVLETGERVDNRGGIAAPAAGADGGGEGGEGGGADGADVRLDVSFGSSLGDDDDVTDVTTRLLPA